MSGNRDGVGSPIERELQYYRRECNELGARLLRLQEEQSQAFLEARRSRTVVRLVREAYRLAEPTRETDDIGSSLLQIIIENALCDRAALLREEPAGSGRFLLAHAIAGAGRDINDVVVIESPPEFFFTSSLRFDRPPGGLLDVLRLPYVLWAYDKSSGHALALGNRSEGNTTRPFESGDQELIEAALSVYLDVLYRKHAEFRLRQAKQSIEDASRAQSEFLKTLSSGLQPPIDRIERLVHACAIYAAETVPGRDLLQQATLELAKSSRELLLLANDARLLATSGEERLPMDMQWLDLASIIRGVFRATYPISVRGGIDLTVALPPRAVSVCVDREGIHVALKTIVSASLARAAAGSPVKLIATRRGDGDVEVLVSVTDELASAFMFDMAPGATPEDGRALLIGPGAEQMLTARRIVEAHDGVLITERRTSNSSQTRILLPAQIARDEISAAHTSKPADRSSLI